MSFARIDRFQASNWPRVHAVAIGLFAMVLSGIVSDRAMAQLRTGRAVRPLYQQRITDQSVQERRSAHGREGAGVEAATYASPVYDPSTVRPAAHLHKTPTVLEESIEAAAVSAACHGCSSGCDACDSMYVQEEFGCGAPGCGPAGCGICSGGYSSIAPTCTAPCPPGCGPLMALWYRLRVRAEVPLYWRRDQGAPILVTSADAGTDADVAGEIGQASTNVLLGGEVLNDRVNAGVRITLGTWLGQNERYGLLFRYWNAGDQDDTFGFDSNEFPILARPILNTEDATTPVPDAQLVAFPGESVGSITVDTSSSVEGLELSFRRLLYMDRFTRVDWLSGYQHVRIDESMTISSSSTVTGNVPALQGNSILVSDRFQTENEFHGGSYGLLSTRQFACWKLETMFRLGTGNLRRKVNIAGNTTTVSGGATATENQGLLARNTNSQPFVDDTFVVVPEVGINFAYRLRRGLDFNVGYNYLLIPKVAQASQQIDNDLAVNLTDPLVGALDPQLDFEERRYWLHSLGLGLQLRY